MTADDEQAVSDLLCRCYRWIAEPEGYTEEQVAYLLSERGSLETVRRESREEQYLVACRDGVLLGVVAVSDDVVTKLYVAPEHHGGGMGRTLFDAAVETVRASGFQRVSLGTTPATVPFYEALGMRVAGHKDHVSGVFSGRRTMLMEKSLPPKE
jgi:ribosomal protein S18 acetylase RimI-like enzyme